MRERNDCTRARTHQKSRQGQADLRAAPPRNYFLREGFDVLVLFFDLLWHPVDGTWNLVRRIRVLLLLLDV